MVAKYMILAVLLSIACTQASVLHAPALVAPAAAAVVAPFASSYNAHHINHAVAVPVAPPPAVALAAPHPLALPVAAPAPAVALAAPHPLSVVGPHPLHLPVAGPAPVAFAAPARVGIAAPLAAAPWAHPLAVAAPPAVLPHRVALATPAPVGLAPAPLVAHARIARPFFL